MQNGDNITLADRAYLERVRLFFGHGVENVISALLGGLLIALVMRSAGVPLAVTASWLGVIAGFSCLVVIIERRFANDVLTIGNANRWVATRTASGGFIGITYGAAPFLFPDSVAIYHEMFTFIILSAMVSISSTSYTLMPYYYLTLNCVTMVPLSIYLLRRPEAIHTLLLTTAILWQVLVLTKAWRVSKTSIAALSLNEQLREEIDEHMRTKEKLQRMATHDGLTGLPNRRLLMERLDVVVKQARRYKRTVAVMFLDLDGFKTINDSYGHDAGDVVLREVADRLKRHARDTDTVARLGGDEFVLVYSELEDSDRETSLLAQRVLDSLEEPISLSASDAERITASIGIAIYPDDSADTNGLVKAADGAMYHVKAKGKNHFAYAGRNGSQKPGS
ncbi:MAG TPA: GGDEF domain-containing protein [Gammaproteobacteria bacterium]|nr:GGDEF domain-containing protein [Gammaproteobacteria bacterium]